MGAFFPQGEVALSETIDKTPHCQKKDCEKINARIQPFSISVDGETVSRSSILGGYSLEQADIQIKYDGLDVKPILNVGLTSLQNNFAGGGEVKFVTLSNYTAFIKRAEIRIVDIFDEKLIAVIPAELNKTISWRMPVGGSGDYNYRLRVYDHNSNYDETASSLLRRTSQNDPVEDYIRDLTIDRANVRNINVFGGSVTVYGKNLPDGFVINTLEQSISVNSDGEFVTQQILPPGDHVVDVSVGIDIKDYLHFSREINIPSNEWFYVALADLTVGKRSGDANIESVRSGDYNKLYNKGRLAYYLKGKIKGNYLVTSSADTREGDVSNLFKNLDQRDPRYLLKNIDTDTYYPVYGDDSTLVDDAPTDGKFYVRIDKGDSHVMWGNYKTRMIGSRFLNSDRALYGAQANYRGPETTSFGERTVDVKSYIAQPETLPQRDVFLATGGTAYFMKRRDIFRGSETITAEYRDEFTGRVTSRRTLILGQDYNINYGSGLVILTNPLSQLSTAEAVRSGALGGEKVWLVAEYDYELTIAEKNGYNYGARAQAWINDYIRLGVSGANEKAGLSDQKMAGADIQLRKSEKTFINSEVAWSRGPGFGSTLSYNGGLNVLDSPTAVTDLKQAMAKNIEAQAELSEFSRFNGIIGGYYEEKQAGFATITEDISNDRRIWGAYARNVAINSAVSIYAQHVGLDVDNGDRKLESKAGIKYGFNPFTTIEFGLIHTSLDSPSSLLAGRNGARWDTGVRLAYSPNEDYKYYVFGQGTASRSGDILRNDRGGVGASYRLTDTIGAEGELSYGTSGLGGLAGLTYNPNTNEQYYIGYRLDPDRAYDLSRGYDLVGRDAGLLVGGVRRRLNENISAYTENSYDLFGQRRSLAQTYGVTYTPDIKWTIDGGASVGKVFDDSIELTTSDVDRYNMRALVSWVDEPIGANARLGGEIRTDRSVNDYYDRDTYVATAGFGYKANEDWRLLARFDAVVSDGARGKFYDGDYVEATLGYAYRPIDNDQINALFRYTYLYDLPSESQISAVSNDTYAPLQRSHILSADANYRFMPWLIVGGKYGMRIGSTRYRLDDNTAGFTEWMQSSEHLGVLRADINIRKIWNILLEGRVRASLDLKTADYGTLISINRDVGNNLKFGVGYNFGNFSDDLRDQVYNDRGWFINIVGKL